VADIRNDTYCVPGAIDVRFRLILFVTTLPRTDTATKSRSRLPRNDHQQTSYSGLHYGRGGAAAGHAGSPDRCYRHRPPRLLIVGGNDPEVLALNRRTIAHLRCEARLTIVPEATHLFEEPGALELVASLAATWFTRHFKSASPDAGAFPEASRLQRD
jgi:hypothetical protein